MPDAPTPDAEASAWLAAATDRVRAAAEEPGSAGRGAARLLAQVGSGAGPLVAAAAVGLGAARVLVERALGG